LASPDALAQPLIFFYGTNSQSQALEIVTSGPYEGGVKEKALIHVSKIAAE